MATSGAMSVQALFRDPAVINEGVRGRFEKTGRLVHGVYEKLTYSASLGDNSLTISL